MIAEMESRRQGDVAILTLRRPEIGNRLSVRAVEDLHRALDETDRRPPRALVLRGDGRDFCTGFDLSDAGEASDGDLLLRFVRIEQLLSRLETAPYLTVALAQGRAIGAGADLFVACSRRLAVSGAVFSFPGSGFGLVLGTRRLGACVGAAQALAIVTEGRAVDAAHALELGLATQLVSPTEIEEELSRAIAALRVSPDVYGALRATQLRRDAADADLAALVRSAARPGLGARIAAYRSSLSTSQARQGAPQ